MQGDTALGLRVFEIVNAGEVAVGQHRVGQRSQMLGRVELRGIGGQEEQMHMVGHAQLDAGMPACTVDTSWHALVLQHDVTPY